MNCPFQFQFRQNDNVNIYCDDTMAYLNSTGIPDHNYLDPKDLLYDQEFSIQFPLYPELETNITYQDPCDFTTVFQLDNKPDDIKYNPIVGFALNGVPFFSPLSIEWVDPFYPPDDKSPEDLDGCVAHVQSTGIYHYHMMPPCLFGDDGNGDTPLVEVGDAKTVALDGFDPNDGLQIIGWAFDGHPIYGPYDDFGNLHNKLDNCNGKKDQNDDYGYYSTPTFPYHVGCFGPGIIPTEPPECTTNY